MTVSIITSVLNRADTIRLAMESVVRQRRIIGVTDTTFEVEYIVVDGGSTDGTVEIIRAFAAELSEAARTAPNLAEGKFSFRWMSEPDRGMYDGLNKGIERSMGEVIGILNADDCLDGDGTLARVVDNWLQVETEKGKIDCLYGNVRFVKKSSGGILRTTRVCFARFWQPWMLQWGYMPPHPGIFIRRECFKQWGLYEPDRREYRIAADYELLIRFFRVHHMRAHYMPVCTTMMLPGGLSTKDVGARKLLNEEIVKGNRAHGYFCVLPMLLPKYLVKIWEIILPRISWGRQNRCTNL